MRHAWSCLICGREDPARTYYLLHYHYYYHYYHYYPPTTTAIRLLPTTTILNQDREQHTTEPRKARRLPESEPHRHREFLARLSNNVCARVPERDSGTYPGLAPRARASAKRCENYIAQKFSEFLRKINASYAPRECDSIQSSRCNRGGGGERKKASRSTRYADRRERDSMCFLLYFGIPPANFRVSDLIRVFRTETAALYVTGTYQVEN